jgi:hypothetical protein
MVLYRHSRWRRTLGITAFTSKYAVGISLDIRSRVMHRWWAHTPGAFWCTSSAAAEYACTKPNRIVSFVYAAGETSVVLLLLGFIGASVLWAALPLSHRETNRIWTFLRGISECAVFFIEDLRDGVNSSFLVHCLRHWSCFTDRSWGDDKRISSSCWIKSITLERRSEEIVGETILMLVSKF